MLKSCRWWWWWWVVVAYRILVSAQVLVFCPGPGPGQDLTGPDLDLDWTGPDLDRDLSLTINPKLLILITDIAWFLNFKLP